MSTPDALLLLLTAGCFVALVVAARLPVSLSLAPRRRSRWRPPRAAGSR